MQTGLTGHVDLRMIGMSVDLMTGILTVFGAGSGGFVGVWSFWFFGCPNRGCCQMKNVHRACEGEKKPPR